MALENAEKEAKETLDELEKKKKWRKTVQKRLQLVAKIAAEEDNSDLGTNNYQSTEFFSFRGKQCARTVVVVIAVVVVLLADFFHNSFDY